MEQSLNNSPEPLSGQPVPAPTQPNQTRRKSWRFALFCACISMVVVGLGLQLAISPSKSAGQASDNRSLLQRALDSVWPATVDALSPPVSTTSNKTTEDSNWEIAVPTPSDEVLALTKTKAPKRKATINQTKVAQTDTAAENEPTSEVSTQACPNAALVCLTSPKPGAVVRGVVQVNGTATGPNFAYYKFEFENDPRCLDPYDGRQICFLASVYTPAVNDTLITFDTRQTPLGARIPNGSYWVRLVVVDQTGNEWPQKARIRITIEN